MTSSGMLPVPGWENNTARIIAVTHEEGGRLLRPSFELTVEEVLALPKTCDRFGRKIKWGRYFAIFTDDGQVYDCYFSVGVAGHSSGRRPMSPKDRAFLFGWLHLLYDTLPFEEALPV